MFNPVLTGAVTSEGKLIGDSISDDLKRMLEISGEAANIILRCNL
jgi:negative regulator of replication initiation